MNTSYLKTRSKETMKGESEDLSESRFLFHKDLVLPSIVHHITYNYCVLCRFVWWLMTSDSLFSVHVRTERVSKYSQFKEVFIFYRQKF